MHKLPLSINHQRLEVIIWVVAFIARCSVSHFKIDNFFRGFVKQPVTITISRLKASTHARR